MSQSQELPEQIISAMQGHALSLGFFDAVNREEPKSAPGTGLTAAIWVQSIRPAMSGLTSTSVRFEVSVRLYLPMLREPQDLIDADLARAAWALMTEYSGNFTLGGIVESIDLMGKDGDPLSWEAGYITVDKTMFRVITLTVPMKINDAFDQVA